MYTKTQNKFKKMLILGGIVGIALIVPLAATAMAQNRGGGGGGHESGGGGHGGGHGGSGGMKRSGRIIDWGVSGRGSLRSVFKDLEGQSAIEELRGQRRGLPGGGQQGQRGGQATTVTGQRGGGEDDLRVDAEEPSEGSRPYWAGISGRGGGGAAGTGDLYGDLYIVERDENGVPVLAPPLDANGNVIEDVPDQLQVYLAEPEGDMKYVPYVVTEGEVELDPAYAPDEAVFSRTSVVRSPDRVLDNQYAEFVTLWNSAETVTVDETNRIILTNDDGTTTSIDSPLIYLALYEKVLTTGTLPDATAKSGDTVAVDLTKLPSELTSLSDATYTADDLNVTAYFIAAAMDKSGTATADMIVYLNAILDVATETNAVSPESDFVSYQDISYSREDTYADKTITVQVPTDPDTWVVVEGEILELVFGGEELPELQGIEAYTQAVDDARAVIDYVHTYAPPE